MSAAEIKHKTLSGPFGEADLEGERLGQEDGLCSYPPPAQSDGAEVPVESDISELRAAVDRKLAELTDAELTDAELYTLMVPPDGDMDANLPGSIEEAVRQVLDQVPRSSSPELPPAAYARASATTAGATGGADEDAEAPDALLPGRLGGPERPDGSNRSGA